MVEPLNIESIGTANFFHYLEVFFLERYKSIEQYANTTLEKFHYGRFSILGEFIIGGFTVVALYWDILSSIRDSIKDMSWDYGRIG